MKQMLEKTEPKEEERGISIERFQTKRKEK